MERKTIAVDLDDVLADFVTDLLKWNNQTYGTNFKKEDVVEPKLEKLWKCASEEAIRRMHLFYNSPEFRAIVPVEGAIQGVEKLVERGHKLHVITARPENTVEQTKVCIDRYFKGKFLEVLFSRNQYQTETSGRKTKAQICRELNADLLIEDLLYYAMECSNQGISVFLFNQPWNQSFELHGIQRVYSWEEIVEKHD